MACSRAARAALGAALCFLTAAGSVGAVGRADAGEQVHAIQRASRSLVRVEASLPVQDAPFRLEPEDAVFSNTGFFVGSDGQVLTSLLGLAGCREIVVICPDGRSSAARVAAMHQPSGLALLTTELKDTPPLELLGEAPAEGSWVLLGSAFPRDGGAVVVFSPGLVSSRTASVRLQGVQWEGLLAASLNVRPGTAAGPLLDPNGGLAGIVLGVAQGDAERAHPVLPGLLDTPECLALPAEQLAPILADLREGRSRRLGWLGVTLVKEPEGREGARVQATLEGSPAHAAGIRAGDILLQVNEHTIDHPSVVARHVVEAGPGRRVEIRLLRGNEIKTVQVELGARPLLICAGQRMAGDSRVHMRAPRRVPLPSPAELLEENRRLRRRIEELERRLLETPEGPDVAPSSP